MKFSLLLLLLFGGGGFLSSGLQLPALPSSRPRPLHQARGVHAPPGNQRQRSGLRGRRDAGESQGQEGGGGGRLERRLRGDREIQAPGGQGRRLPLGLRQRVPQQGRAWSRALCASDECRLQQVCGSAIGGGVTRAKEMWDVGPNGRSFGDFAWCFCRAAGAGSVRSERGEVEYYTIYGSLESSGAVIVLFFFMKELQRFPNHLVWSHFACLGGAESRTTYK